MVHKHLMFQIQYLMTQGLFFPVLAKKSFLSSGQGASIIPNVSLIISQLVGQSVHVIFFQH